MILCEDEYPKILDEIAEFLGAGAVELVFVSGEEMRAINARTRGIDKSTDVLSFPLIATPDTDALIGSVVINTDLASQKADELGHSHADEMSLLFTHGLLHILGFDHEIDNGEMREKECEVIAKFGLPKSLIVRTLESDEI